MTQIEYEEVLKAFDINKEENLANWHGLKIYFTGDYYTFIKGEISLELANTIYHKYIKKQYGIKVNGSYDIKNPDNHKVEFYQIERKDGFVLLLTEIYNYFAKKEGQSLLNFADRLEKINIALIEKIDPFTSTEEWMKNHTCNFEKYQEMVKQSTIHTNSKAFRMALNVFDLNINPFMNQNNRKKINDFVKKVNIRANKTEDESKLIFWNPESGNAIHCNRTSTGFSYGIQYMTEEKEIVSVIHFYTPNAGCEYYNTENISVFKNKNALHYDITNDSLIDIKTNERRKITAEEKNILYSELLQAICEAQKITLSFIKEQPLIRKLET